MKMGLLLLFSAILLSSCGTVKTIFTRPSIPEYLRTCAEEPNPPANVTTQSQVSVYILDLANAGADCRSKLESINRLFPENKD